MTETENRIDKLCTEFEDREDDSELLDDLVHDAASRIGSGVNNGGLSEQIEFLVEHGFTDAEIREAFAE